MYMYPKECTGGLLLWSKLSELDLCDHLVILLHTSYEPLQKLYYSMDMYT